MLLLVTAASCFWIGDFIGRQRQVIGPVAASKALGFPEGFEGFTVIRQDQESGVVMHGSACPNCGFPSMMIAIKYPSEPGSGWRAKDLATIQNALSPGTVVASK